MNNTKRKRLCAALVLSLLLVCVMGTTAFAAGTGDVAGARHPVCLPRVHADGSAVHLADHRDLRYRQ